MPLLRTVVVAQTWYLASGGYEIVVSPDLEPITRRTSLLTRDPEVYTMAAVAEGYPIYFDVTWRPARRANGTTCQVLETLMLADQRTKAARMEGADNEREP